MHISSNNFGVLSADFANNTYSNVICTSRKGDSYIDFNGFAKPTNGIYIFNLDVNEYQTVNVTALENINDFIPIYHPATGLINAHNSYIISTVSSTHCDLVTINCLIQNNLSLNNLKIITPTLQTNFVTNLGLYNFNDLSTNLKSTHSGNGNYNLNYNRYSNTLAVNITHHTNPAICIWYNDGFAFTNCPIFPFARPTVGTTSTVVEQFQGFGDGSLFASCISVNTLSSSFNTCSLGFATYNANYGDSIASGSSFSLKKSIGRSVPSFSQTTDITNTMLVRRPAGYGFFWKTSQTTLSNLSHLVFPV